MTLDMQTAPKTNQLNYDDIPNGKSITITIASVKGNTDPQQPISVHYEGDNGKPYKPGLSMRRALVMAWGDDGIEYVGKSMTLFGDPSITFGPQKVGGIRISHMSHIDKELNFPLTISKGKKKPFIVKQLKIDVGSVDEEVDNTELLKAAKEAAKQGKKSFTKYFNTHNENEREAIKTIMPELQKLCAKADDPLEQLPADTETAIPSDEPDAVEADKGVTENVTPAPFELIRDSDKRLAPDEIITAINQYSNPEDVRHCIHMHKNFMDEMTTSDQMTILKARDKKIKELG